MLEFLATILSFPTVVFTGLLALVILYWCVVILGAVDLDFLDGLLGLDGLESTLDSALDALDGAADGGLDLESASGAKAGALSGVMNALGVTGVPVTIVASAVIFWAFLLSYAGTKLVGTLGASLLIDLLIAAGALALALGLGSATIRPFRGVFVTEIAARRATLVGKLATVTSSRVDGSFGRAEIEDGGAGFVAEVRCPQENALTRGAKALVYRYEPSEGIFFIGPVDEVLTAADSVVEETEA